MEGVYSFVAEPRTDGRVNVRGTTTDGRVNVVVTKGRTAESTPDGLFETRGGRSGWKVMTHRWIRSEKSEEESDGENLVGKN